MGSLAAIAPQNNTISFPYKNKIHLEIFFYLKIDKRLF
jgi:hypothetical protein